MLERRGGRGFCLNLSRYAMNLSRFNVLTLFATLELFQNLYFSYKGFSKISELETKKLATQQQNVR